MVGQTVSHYRVLEKLGEGGMGEVYLAEDTSLERKVALKFLPPKLRQDTIAHKRFIREAKSAAAIEHPFICNIKEVSQTDDGQDFIVMEYVEGQTLNEKLEQGRISLKEAVQISSEVAEALEKAHSSGVIHRDLKPSNIMTTLEGHTKVLDFGLAKRITRDQEDLTTVLTREGSTLGTLAYMSPEQVKAEKVDTRTDIFSLGVVLYEILSGVHPFRTGTQAETVNAILSEHPSPLPRYVPGIPNLLQHTVEKMLAKDPGKRYQAIHEVRTNLVEVQEEITDRQTLPRTTKTRTHWVAGVLGGGIAVVAALLGWLYIRGPVTPATSITLKPIPLTSYPGHESEASFSPDGNQIAFSWNGSTEDNRDIYLKVVGLGEPHRLTTEPEPDVSPIWSPDGRQIAFLRQVEGEGVIFLIPALGGDGAATGQNRGRIRQSTFVGTERTANSRTRWTKLGLSYSQYG